MSNRLFRKASFLYTVSGIYTHDSFFLSGVKGIIKDDSGAPIAGAKVDIVGRKFGRNSTEQGEYWRLLLAGIYNITVRKRKLIRVLLYLCVSIVWPLT